LTGDITSVASIDQMVAEARNAYGRLDILIYNAGVYLNRPAPETTEADWNPWPILT
jgi:NAD(P)-dependent dehydrogenase (short-subunit alcohol dehydrogenase family)